MKEQTDLSKNIARKTPSFKIKKTMILREFGTFSHLRSRHLTFNIIKTF